ncbi:hypothetical protein SAMN04487830_10643 [Pseudobutyrivibrio sp. OR37]|uniref:hypothetical protein n=1 Tax=Pseudobutyrivibrio sp. OR37 TaxID=1798186 RepID=UPI0008EBF645|nr:hypothetical protein [Pseudobutyrivibrio sp. OR37]SFH71516.1 hypothetical protein SAMN04487830_10643 [Pseudobutyrivibrio sp. OR37]
MRKKPKLSKNVCKDVVLCRTTNRQVSNRTSDLLLEQSVAFSKSFQPIPFFLRRKYNGARQFYIISISRIQYSKARHALTLLEERDLSRLWLNVI